MKRTYRLTPEVAVDPHPARLASILSRRWFGIEVEQGRGNEADFCARQRTLPERGCQRE